MGKEVFLDIRKTANVKIGFNNNVTIEFANDYILDLLKYNLTEFVTKTPKTICHPDMPDIIHDTIGGLIVGYKEGIAVLKHITKDGDYFWAFTHYKPVYKLNGNFDAFLTRRKPLPSKKLNGDIADLKLQISKLYEILKSIEQHTGIKQATKYLEGFLEYKGYNTLDEYYMSFFNFKKNELEDYFAIDENTPERKVKKYTNYINPFEEI